MSVIHLAPDELSAVEHLKDRLIIIHAPLSDYTASDLAFLRQRGFLQGYLNMAQIVRVSEFKTDEEYLRTLREQKRSMIRQALRTFDTMKMECRVSRIKEIQQGELTAFYTDVFFPACSYRSISPYGGLFAAEFQNLISSLDQAAPGYFLSVHSNDQIVAGAFFQIINMKSMTETYSQKSSDGRMDWEAAASPDAKVLDLKVVHAHPTWGGKKNAAMLSTVLYWRLLSWAILNKIDFFSGGDESRSICPEQYLGVLSFKKSWGMSTALFSSPSMTVFFSAPEWRYVRIRHNVLIPHLHPSGKVFLRYVLPDSATSSRNRLLLTSDKHFDREICVGSEEDAEAIQIMLAEYNLKGTVSTYQIGGHD